MDSRRHFLSATVAAFLFESDLLALGKEEGPRVIPVSDWKRNPKFLPLSKGFEAITSGSLADKAPGRYDLDGDRLYATVVEDDTQDPTKGSFEVHHRYVDIHYLIAGREMIGSADPKLLTLQKPYDEKGDAELFGLPSSYRHLHLRPGHCAVFFPGQAHFPGRWDPKQDKIRKIVVKVLQGS
jgi:YhcH/YjgK/YiaL family protein